MKKALFITSFLICGISLSGFAQNNVKSSDFNKTVIKTSETSYDVLIKNKEGLIIQKGEYAKAGDKLLPHGTWTLFAHNSDKVLTKIKYDKGEKIWLETNVNGETKRLNSRDLTIHRLETRIAHLENKIESDNE